MRAPPTSLANNAAHTLAGNVFYALAQFAQLTVLVRLGSAQQVGQFAMALALTTPVMLATGLQLRAMQAIDARQSYTFGHYLALRIAGIAVAWVVIAAMVAMSRRPAEEIMVILAMGLAKGVESLSDVAQGNLQRAERMASIAISQALRGALGCCLFVLSFAISGSVAIAVLGLAAAWLAVAFAWDLRKVARMAASRVLPHWHWRVLAELARKASPLAISAILMSLCVNTPVYLIERHLGTTSVGQYASLLWLVSTGSMAVVAICSTLSPRFARLHADGKPAQARRLLRLALLGTLLLALFAVLAASWFGRHILVLVYGPAYGGFAPELTWMAVAAGIGWPASLFGYYATAKRQLMIVIPISVAALATSLLACLWLVPAHGLLGAAASGVMVASLLLCGFGWAATRPSAGPCPLRHGDGAGPHDAPAAASGIAGAAGGR